MSIETLKGINKLSEWKAEDLLKEAQLIAKSFRSSKLDTQLRRIFDTFRSIEIEFKNSGFNRDELLLVKPKLIYTIARNKNLAPLHEPLMEVIDKVHDDKDFSKLISFVEAILAYYKAKDLERSYNAKGYKQYEGRRR